MGKEFLMNTLEFILTLNNSNFVQGVKQMDSAMQQVVKRGVGLEKLQQRLDGFKENLAKLGVLGAGLGMFIKEGADFERALDVATSKMKGVEKGGENFKALKRNIEELGAETELSNNQITGIVESLAMAGVSIKQMGKEDLRAMANFSIAGNVDGQTSADIITNIQSALGGSFTELGDKIIETATSSNTSAVSLGESLKYAATSAKMAGQSKDTVFALAGALGNVGVQGSMAGTTMARFFTSMASAQDKFRSLGINVQKNGKMRDAMEVFKELIEKTKRLDEATKLNVFKGLFGERGFKVAGANVKDFDRLVKGIRDSEGKMKRVAAGINDNATGDLKELSSVFSALRNAVFNVFHDDLRKIIPKLTGFVDGLKAFSGEHPLLVKGAIGLGFAFLGVKTALSGLLVPLIAFNQLLLKNSFGFLKGLVLLRAGFLGLVPAIWSTTIALLANPIFWGVAAVAGLVTGFVYLWRNSERFKKVVTSIGVILWDWVKSTAQFIWKIAQLSPIFMAWKAILTWIWKAVKDIGSWIGDLFKSFENSSFVKMLSSGLGSVEQTINMKAASIEQTHKHEVVMKLPKGASVEKIKTDGSLPLKFDVGATY